MNKPWKRTCALAAYEYWHFLSWHSRKVFFMERKSLGKYISPSRVNENYWYCSTDNLKESGRNFAKMAFYFNNLSFATGPDLTRTHNRANGGLTNEIENHDWLNASLQFASFLVWCLENQHLCKQMFGSAECVRRGIAAQCAGESCILCATCTENTRSKQAAIALPLLEYARATSRFFPLQEKNNWHFCFVFTQTTICTAVKMWANKFGQFPSWCAFCCNVNQCVCRLAHMHNWCAWQCSSPWIFHQLRDSSCITDQTYKTYFSALHFYLLLPDCSVSTCFSPIPTFSKEMVVCPKQPFVKVARSVLPSVYSQPGLVGSKISATNEKPMQPSHISKEQKSANKRNISDTKTSLNAFSDDAFWKLHFLSLSSFSFHIFFVCSIFFSFFCRDRFEDGEFPQK